MDPGGDLGGDLVNRLRKLEAENASLRVELSGSSSHAELASTPAPASALGAAVSTKEPVAPAWPLVPAGEAQSPMATTKKTTTAKEKEEMASRRACWSTAEVFELRRAMRELPSSIERTSRWRQIAERVNSVEKNGGAGCTGVDRATSRECYVKAVELAKEVRKDHEAINGSCRARVRGNVRSQI